MNIDILRVLKKETLVLIFCACCIELKTRLSITDELLEKFMLKIVLET